MLMANRRILNNRMFQSIKFPLRCRKLNLHFLLIRNYLKENVKAEGRAGVEEKSAYAKGRISRHKDIKIIFFMFEERSNIKHHIVILNANKFCLR